MRNKPRNHHRVDDSPILSIWAAVYFLVFLYFACQLFAGWFY